MVHSFLSNSCPIPVLFPVSFRRDSFHFVGRLFCTRIGRQSMQRTKTRLRCRGSRGSDKTRGPCLDTAEVTGSTQP